MAGANKKEEEVYLDIFCEFLEVLIHQIIFLRDLYPVSIFEKRRKFNMPLNMSVQPWVSDFINPCPLLIILIRPFLRKFLCLILLLHSLLS